MTNFKPRTGSLAIALFGLMIVVGVRATVHDSGPDLVLVNGKIFTSNAAHAYVQALAIRGERIIAIGDSKQIRALAGAHTIAAS